jgi:hypothetical protein
MRKESATEVSLRDFGPREEKIVNAAFTFPRGWGDERSETSSRSAPVRGDSQPLSRETLWLPETTLARVRLGRSEKGDFGREMLPSEGLVGENLEGDKS